MLLNFPNIYYHNWITPVTCKFVNCYAFWLDSVIKFYVNFYTLASMLMEGSLLIIFCCCTCQLTLSTIPYDLNSIDPLMSSTFSPTLIFLYVTLIYPYHCIHLIYLTNLNNILTRNHCFWKGMVFEYPSSLSRSYKSLVSISLGFFFYCCHSPLHFYFSCYDIQRTDFDYLI